MEGTCMRAPQRAETQQRLSAEQRLAIVKSPIVKRAVHHREQRLSRGSVQSSACQLAVKLSVHTQCGAAPGNQSPQSNHRKPRAVKLFVQVFFWDRAASMPCLVHAR
eukprot:1158597-Pelagomonas_calceolata.AAC.3